MKTFLIILTSFLVALIIGAYLYARIFVSMLQPGGELE